MTALPTPVSHDSDGGEILNTMDTDHSVGEIYWDTAQQGTGYLLLSGGWRGLGNGSNYYE